MLFQSTLRSRVATGRTWAPLPSCRTDWVCSVCLMSWPSDHTVRTQAIRLLRSRLPAILPGAGSSPRVFNCITRQTRMPCLQPLDHLDAVRRLAVHAHVVVRIAARDDHALTLRGLDQVKEPERRRVTQVTRVPISIHASAWEATADRFLAAGHHLFQSTLTAKEATGQCRST